MTITYRIDSARSQVTLMTTSSVHDVECTGRKLSGKLVGNPEDISSGSEIDVQIEMKGFEAGDWLKTRKLHSYLEIKKHPTSRFRLTGISAVEKVGEGQFKANLTGEFTFQGKTWPINAEAEGRIDERRVSGDANFQIFLPDMGLSAPSFMFVKMSDDVRVKVHLEASC